MYRASREREAASSASPNTSGEAVRTPWMRRLTVQNQAPIQIIPKLAASEAAMNSGRAPRSSSATSVHLDCTTQTAAAPSPAM